MRNHLRFTSAGAAAVAAAVCFTFAASGTAQAAQGPVAVAEIESGQQLTYDDPVGCIAVGSMGSTNIYNGTDQVIYLHDVDCDGQGDPLGPGNSRLLSGGLGAFYAP